MRHSEKHKERLKDGDTVAVVGGGPSGTFFSIHLLREAKKLNRAINVVLIEKKDVPGPDKEPRCIKGCNYCAGGISPRLNELLTRSGIHVPPEVVQGEIERVWIHGLWKNFPLKVPKEMRMYSVLRGSLPARQEGGINGFDGFLLKSAAAEGARILHGEVLEIDYDGAGLPRLTVRRPSGSVDQMPAHFVALSTGVNCQRGEDYKDNSLIRSFRKVNPSFVPAGSRKALIFELEVGHEYLRRNLNREVYFIEYGSKALSLGHVALVPKGTFLTVALIGKCIDEAVLPKEAGNIVRETLALPHLRRLLPNIEAYSPACVCTPRMSVRPARHPFTDRIALVGDAVGSRLNKDGLYSAFRTAKTLAATVLHQGIDQTNLELGYGPVVRWLARDNRYGRAVFGLSRLTFSTPILSRIMYQAFATELKTRDPSKRPIGKVLWKIASGTSDYREVLVNMLNFSVHRSFLIGGLLLTLRNLLTEMFFGLKWGEYGRYPTLIIKEKRAYIKGIIERNLGIRLEDTPDFEKMYVIKIRASHKDIFDELGKFGDNDRNYLKLRFIEVKGLSGKPNEVDSVIGYHLCLLGLLLQMRLTKVRHHHTLYYSVDEKFADRGKLIFDINTTKDGNSSLVIYTAFDYKKGSGLLTRTLCRLFRLFFPAFLHDIFWNHALCRIKEDVELPPSHSIRPANMPASNNPK